MNQPRYLSCYEKAARGHTIVPCVSATWGELFCGDLQGQVESRTFSLMAFRQNPSKSRAAVTAINLATFVSRERLDTGILSPILPRP